MRAKEGCEDGEGNAEEEDEGCYDDEEDEHDEEDVAEIHTPKPCI